MFTSLISPLDIFLPIGNEIYKEVDRKKNARATWKHKNIRGTIILFSISPCSKHYLCVSLDLYRVLTSIQFSERDPSQQSIMVNIFVLSSLS